MNPFVAVVARLLARKKRTCPKCGHVFTAPPGQSDAPATCPKCKAKVPPKGN